MAVGGGRGVDVAGGGAVAVAGGRGVQVGVGARGFGVEVGAAANARAGAATLVGVDSGVFVVVGARMGVEVAVGSAGRGVAVAGDDVGPAWAGSVGLIAAVALGRTAWAGSVGLSACPAASRVGVGGVAAQAVRKTAARSRNTRATNGDRRPTGTILRPTVKSVNSRVGRRPLAARLISVEGLRAGQTLAGDEVWFAWVGAADALAA